jgi:4-amino-4-deoxy-L-arabinose transferase-like glycosyltransferase
VLLALLVVAGVLRFTGLSAGLRHPAHVDEEPFVLHATQMLARGELDHRFHEYPAVFIYVLAAAFGLLGLSTPGPEAYLVARAVVAGFSVASVALVYRLGAALAGPPAGLVAAALLAVSPLEIRLCHAVRPDVVLHTFTLLALLVLARAGAGRRDALSGVAVAAAAAVKFTGVLLAPVYLAQRLRSPGPLRGVLIASVAGLLAFAVLSPYTLIRLPAAVHGAWYQVSWHYAGEPAAGYWARVAEYGGVLVAALGWGGSALAALGMIAWRREWRDWAFLALLPLLAVVVTSTAHVVHARLVLFAVGPLAVFAGRGLAALAAGSGRAAVAVAFLAVLPPLAVSGTYVFKLTRPSTKDLARDWIERHVPAGSSILATWSGRIGLDPGRYRVLRVDHLDDETLPLALHADIVIAGPTESRRRLEALELLVRIRPEHREAGTRIEILRPPRRPLGPRPDAWARAETPPD